MAHGWYEFTKVFQDAYQLNTGGAEFVAMSLLAKHNLKLAACVVLLLPCLAWCANASPAGEALPFPFEGLYESHGNPARERVVENEWREIPQVVRMRVIRDENITELNLHIQVFGQHGHDSGPLYSITNTIWLVTKRQLTGDAKSGRVDFDVFKYTPSFHGFHSITGAGVYG